jgi:hypothetical protein
MDTKGGKARKEAQPLGLAHFFEFAFSLRRCFRIFMLRFQYLPLL